METADIIKSLQNRILELEAELKRVEKRNQPTSEERKLASRLRYREIRKSKLPTSNICPSCQLEVKDEKNWFIVGNEAKCRSCSAANVNLTTIQQSVLRMLPSHTATTSETFSWLLASAEVVLEYKPHADKLLFGWENRKEILETLSKKLNLPASRILDVVANKYVPSRFLEELESALELPPNSLRVDFEDEEWLAFFLLSNWTEDFSRLPTQLRSHLLAGTDVRADRFQTSSNRNRIYLTKLQFSKLVGNIFTYKAKIGLE